MPVHHRLRFLTFPMRTSRLCSLWPDMRPLRFRRVPFGRDVAFDPGGATASRTAMPHMLPSTVPSVSASAKLLLSWLNPPPHPITVYASHPPSPTTAQHSLPGGALPPYRGRSFTGRIASASPDAPEHEVGTRLKRNFVALLGRQREIFKMGLAVLARIDPYDHARAPFQRELIVHLGHHSVQTGHDGGQLVEQGVRTAMPVIDVQVHPFDRNHPGRPWASPSHGLDSATGEEMVAAMNSVGVDGAIMVSSFSAYEYDPSYALEVYNTYPNKFRVVTPVDATNPAIDDVVTKWAATPGARGIRIRMRDGLPMDADHPGLNRAFAAAAKHGLPVNLLCWGILDKGLPHIQRHRDTVIVIDHLGLLQPARPPVPADVWADLPKLLALARYENVRVKISGACTMSHQSFPYDDIWEPVLRVIDAFGLDRCMWGTDWTRTIGMLTYEQGVAPFRDTKRLSESDKAALMGGTLQKVYKW